LFLGSRGLSQELKIEKACYVKVRGCFCSWALKHGAASEMWQEFQIVWNEILFCIFGTFGSLVYRECA